MKRGEILDAVKNTITKDRNDRHGEPENSFPRIAEVWSDYLKRLGWVEPKLKPSDVAEMLAIFKTCRFETQPDNPDNEHDRIGYYAIAAELRTKERAKERAKPLHVNLSLDEVSRHHMMPPGGSVSDYDWKSDEPQQENSAIATHEVINGGPPPAPPGFPPRPPKHKNDTTIHENKIFEARKRHGANELFWVYGGEAPGTPNRKPNFEGEVWVCVSGNFKGFEWTAKPSNSNPELLWHRTK